MGKCFWYKRGGTELVGLGDALLDYSRKTGGQSPKPIVVNSQLVDVARSAVEQLGLSVEVATAGGCLLGEVWLEVAVPLEVAAPPEVAG